MKIIPLYNSELLISVDDEDYMRFVLFNWHISGYGYAFMPGKPNEYLHIILGRKLGFLNKVDHVDRNKLNNQRINLRAATQTQNGQNSKKQLGTSSKYKGVTFERRRNKWEAKIQVNGIKHWLGYFTNEEEAALAYNRAALKYFGEFANLNQMPNWTEK